MLSRYGLCLFIILSTSGLNDRSVATATEPLSVRPAVRTISDALPSNVVIPVRFGPGGFRHSYGYYNGRGYYGPYYGNLGYYGNNGYWPGVYNGNFNYNSNLYGPGYSFGYVAPYYGGGYYSPYGYGYGYAYPTYVW